MASTQSHEQELAGEIVEENAAATSEAADKAVKEDAASSLEHGRQQEQQPQQPKKPVGGGFGRYLAENRAELVKEVEGKPASAVTKLAAERWQNLSEEEKMQWKEKFAQATEQYTKDMEAFEAAGGQKSSPKSKGKKNKEKAMKDPAAPKMPAGGAYGRYMAKHRDGLMKECAGKPITEIARLGGQRWKALSEEEKKPYEEEYKKAMDDYREAMKHYAPPAAEQPVVMEVKGAKKAGKRSAKASAEVTTPPAKKARSEGPSASKAAGNAAARPRGKAVALAPKTVLLDKEVAQRAEKAGMSANLMKLAALEDVAAIGKGHAEMLKVLKASNGLFHPARRALLGA